MTVVSDDVRAELEEFLDGLRARDSIVDYKIVTHPDGTVDAYIEQHPVLKTITCDSRAYRKAIDDMVRELEAELKAR
jgi:hypothetical protein